MIGIDHRQFRALAKGGRAVRRARGAARHQPDLDRDARPISTGRSISTWRPRRRPPARSRCRWRAAAGPAGLGHRPRRQADDRSEPAAPGRRAAAGGRQRGGYKGYGLAVMVEILCGLLTGLGFGVEPTGRHNDGCFMAVLQGRRVPAARRIQKGDRRVRPISEGDKAGRRQQRRLYPGEIEHMPRSRTAAPNGIEVEDSDLGQDEVARAGLRPRPPARALNKTPSRRRGRVSPQALLKDAAAIVGAVAQIKEFRRGMIGRKRHDPPALRQQ